MAVDYNSVPLGQAGTGSAFVLGGSQAAQTLANTLDYNQKIAQQNALLKQQQAQQLANSWRQNQLKVDGGLYWQPEFNKRYQQHMEKGIQLRQMGVDPFNYNANDPTQSKIAEDYLMERQGILADTANRKATEDEIKKSFDLVRKDPSKYYASDIQNLNKFVETPYAEAMNMSIPTLTERFDPNSLLSKITPAQVGSELVIGNKKIKSVKALPEQTREAIVGAYRNDANTARWVDELTGRQGFTIPVLESIPNTKEAVKAKLEAQYNGNPDVRTQLAQQGITPNSDKYKAFMDTEANRLYNAKKTWNDQIQSDLQQVLPKVKQMESVLPDYSAEDQAMQRERMSLAREANSRAQTRMSDYIAKKKEDKSYDSFLKDVVDTKPTAIKELNSVIDEIGGKARKVYDETLTIDGKKVRVKNAVVVDVPVETTVDATDSDGNKIENNDGSIKKVKTTVNKRYVLGRSGGKSAEVVLNQILNRTKSFGAAKQNTVLPYNENESPTIEDWEE